jgi:hypothetical protein
MIGRDGAVLKDRNMCRCGVLVSLILLFAQVSAAAPFVVAERGISLELPDGYRRSDEGWIPNGYAFSRGEETLVVVFSDQRWEQNSHVRRSDNEAALRSASVNQGVKDLVFEYREVSWKTVQLEVTIVRSKQKGTVSFAARVPLASGMAVVMIDGPLAEEPKLSAEFDAVMSSLKGKTNWTTDFDHLKQVGSYVALALVPLAILMVAALALARRRQRPN